MNHQDRVRRAAGEPPMLLPMKRWRATCARHEYPYERVYTAREPEVVLCAQCREPMESVRE